MLDCQDTIIFKGDNAPNANLRNVRAEWFNLPSDFVGTLSLCPKQEQAALWMEYNQSLCAWFDSDLFKGRWISIAIPLAYVKNSLNPIQTIENPGTQAPGQFTNILDAFNAPDITSSRLYFGDKKLLTVPEIRFSFGTTVIECDDFHLSAYTTVVWPTAKKVKPTFLFNPTIGPNGHIGFGGGVRFELPLHCDDADLKIFLTGQVESIYYFHNTQCRTFDIFKPIDRGCDCVGSLVDCTPFYPRFLLPPQDIIDVDVTCKNTQWSRFMPFQTKDGIRARGTDILTFPVHITPYATTMFLGSFQIDYFGFQAELGYELWGRNAERAEFVKPCCEPRDFIFQDFGIAGTLPGTTSSQSTIKEQAPNDLKFVNIRPQDIAFSAGLYAGGFTNKLFFNVGYTSPEIMPFFAIGGFYEFPNPLRNSMFKQWGIWSKLGVQF